MKERFRRFGVLWQRVPGSMRKTVVAVIGATLVLLGLALIVLPGPFTIPLLIAGFAVLGTEFAWAGRLLQRTRDGLDRTTAIAKSAGSKVTGTARRVARRPKSRG